MFELARQEAAHRRQRRAERNGQERFLTGLHAEMRNRHRPPVKPKVAELRVRRRTPEAGQG